MKRRNRGLAIVLLAAIAFLGVASLVHTHDAASLGLYDEACPLLNAVGHLAAPSRLPLIVFRVHRAIAAPLATAPCRVTTDVSEPAPPRAPPQA